MSIQAAFRREPLYGGEAALELAICRVQCEAGVDTSLPAEVDAREQEIAELVLQLGVHFVIYRGPMRPCPDRALLQVHLHFAELLLDFGSRTGNIGPVEANTRRAILQPVRPVQRRECPGQTLSDPLPPARLHPLPHLPGPVLVQVRMPPLHFAHQPLSYRAGVEGTTFLCYNAVKQDLEEQVAELLAHMLVHTRSDSLIELVCFLDQVGPERVMCLGGVPVAPLPEITHESERIVERGSVVHRAVGGRGRENCARGRRSRPARTVERGALTT